MLYSINSLSKSLINCPGPKWSPMPPNTSTQPPRTTFKQSNCHPSRSPSTRPGGMCAAIVSAAPDEGGERSVPNLYSGTYWILLDWAQSPVTPPEYVGNAEKSHPKSTSNLTLTFYRFLTDFSPIWLPSLAPLLISLATCSLRNPSKMHQN